MIREISLARHAYELLKPLEANADTINVERHLPTHFHLSPPKAETGIPFSPGYGPMISSSSSHAPEVDSISPPKIRSTFQGSSSEDRSRSISHSLQVPRSSEFRQRLATPGTELSSENLTSSDGALQMDAHKPLESSSTTESVMETPFSPDSIGTGHAFQHPSIERSTSIAAFNLATVPRSRTVPVLSSPPDKGKAGWRTKLTRSKKESYKPSGDTSSSSSNTLEPQKLDEISLKSLSSVPKGIMRGKSGRNINVQLSQNSSHALFWTQPSIHILDVGTSPPTVIRAVSTESTCVLAAITKFHLAYIIGTRDQKLTVSRFTSRYSYVLIIFSFES